MAGWFPPRGSEEGVVTDISFVLRNEVLQFDPDRIGALEFEYGPEATEDVLYSTTEQIVGELGPLQIAISSGDRTAVGEIDPDRDVKRQGRVGDDLESRDGRQPLFEIWE